MVRVPGGLLLCPLCRKYYNRMGGDSLDTMINDALRGRPS